MFRPNDPITREQLALIFQRYLEYEQRPLLEKIEDLSNFPDYLDISNYALDGIKWAIKYGIIKGNGDGTLNPKGFATRAETAMMYMRYCTELPNKEWDD